MQEYKQLQNIWKKKAILDWIIPLNKPKWLSIPIVNTRLLYEYLYILFLFVKYFKIKKLIIIRIQKNNIDKVISNFSKLDFIKNIGKTEKKKN